VRPLRLHIEGFGAFAEPVEIDLSTIAGSTLLLIYGPTGAGKTTIFDALCFALYGISSGARTPVQMRSDHCAPGTSTRVICEFSLPSGIYRITREFKPRRTLDSYEEKGVLEFLDAGGAAIRSPVTKKTEIRDEVERLLGLNADQFRQIVMLPQNDFQKMLLADTKAKQVILEKLFRASLYSRMTQILSEMTQGKRSEFEELKNRISGFLASHGVDDAAALAGRHIDAERTSVAIAARLPGLRKEWEDARDAREDGERVLGHHVELRQAQDSLRQHCALAPDVEAERLRLETALRAEPLRSHLAEIEEGEKRAGERRHTIETLRASILTTSRQKDEAQREVDLAGRRNEEILRLQVEVHRFESARPQLLKLENDRLTAGQIDRQLGELGTRLQECVLEKDALTQELARHEADLPGFEAAAFKLTGLQESMRRVRELQSPFDELQRLRQQFPGLQREVAGAEAALGQATERSRKETEVLAFIETRWAESQAARLSSALKPGQPCPVCGSPDHPRPAPCGGEEITDAALSAARARRDATEHERQEAQSRLVTARSALAQNTAAQYSHAGILGELAGGDPAAFAAHRRQQERDLTVARKSADQLDTVRKKRTMCTERLRKLQQDHEAFQEQKTAMTRERATVMAQIQGAVNAIGEDVPDIQTLEHKHAEAGQRAAALRQQVENAQIRHTALAGEVIRFHTRCNEETKELNAEEARMALKRKTLSESLVRGGFRSVGEVAKALLPEGERRRLTSLVHQWDEKAVTLRNTVEERQRVVAGRSEPDLAPLSRVEEQARNAHDAEQQLATEARATAHRLEAATGQLRHMTGQLETLRSESGQIQELSDAVSGRNELGLTLSSYVLSVFLDEIVTFANQRLRVISHDRYALIRRTESDDRRRRAGLDLDVFDNYTGDQRQVQTLSGGEQFYAALSLALGVADAAQQHTGGVRMDAMFIDEGFGSLDSETLDVAIRALMDIQADGRIVAIISHVEELRTRIPVRLEVVKGKTGSSIRWSDN
jgi:DNA repair protein SbcC/Rad50